MRKGTKKPMGKAKRGFLVSGLFIGIFAVTAVGTFFAIPQQKTIIPTTSDNPIEETPSQKLLSNLLDSLPNGIGATFKEGSTFTIAGKDGYDNVLAFKDTNLKFKADKLDIHGIDLVMDAKIDYNSKIRGLDIALVDDELYFDIKDYEKDSWDLKYVVSTASSDILDENGEPITDPETGGILHYSYGTLDWVIEDICSILTGNGVNLKFPSLGALLDGSSSNETTSSGEEESSGSKIDGQAILDSLNEMTMDEEPVEGCSYFRWDLVIGEDTYHIGLKADPTTYDLAGIDFPAVTVNGNSITQGDFELNENMKAKIRLDVATNDLEFAVPYDKQEYRRLENSLALFEKVADVASSLKFGVDLSLDLSYEVEGKEADVYNFKKDEIKDKANLSIKGNVDAKGGNLNSLDASLSFKQDGSDGSQNLKAYYEENNMYVNLNDVLRAQTTKLALDELIGCIKDNLNKPVATAADPIAANQEENTEVQAQKTESAIQSAINAVKNSKFITDFNHGVYTSALDFIKSIESNDNWIKITLDLEPIGIEGGVVITIGNTSLTNEAKMKDVTPVLNIEFVDIKFASFFLKGSLKVIDYEHNTLSEEAKATYSEMSHIGGTYESKEGLVNQIFDIVDKKAATIDLSGSIVVANTTSKDGNNPIGATFKGKVALDGSDKLAAGAKITVKEYEENFIQDHNLKLDIAPIENEGVSSSTVFFSYDSINAEKTENNTDPKTDEPVKGTIATSDAKDVIDRIIDWATGSLDSRFSRISRAISKPGNNELLKQLTSGNYFALADLHVLKSVSISSDKDVFVINAAQLGLDNDITITINFTGTNEIESIGISGSFGKDEEHQTELNLVLGLTSGAEANDLTTLDSHDVTTYCDYGSLLSLAEYGVNTTTLGAINQDGHGQSSIGLEANVDLVMGNYTMNALKLDGAFAIDGAQLQMAVGIDSCPVIKGINGPEDEKFFRPHEYEGMRDMDFYFYADGLETNDEVMMTRDSDYGKLRDVKESVRMDRETFSNDLGGWLLKYFLGVNESAFNKETTNEETTSEKSYGLPLSKAIHVMDMFHGIEYVAPSEENPDTQWVINLDTAKLGLGVLGEVTLKVSGSTVKDANDNPFKTLTSLRLEANVALGGEVKVLKLVVDLSLTNVANNTYTNIWNKTYVPNYFTYFRPLEGEATPFCSVASRNRNIAHGTKGSNLY